MSSGGWRRRSTYWVRLLRCIVYNGGAGQGVVTSLARYSNRKTAGMGSMDPAVAAELRRKWYNATVVSLRKTHSDLMILRVRPDFARPLHKPGQHSTLGLGSW